MGTRHRSTWRLATVAAGFVLALSGLMTGAAHAAPAVVDSKLMLVMDSSGSMKQKLPHGAGSKISAAKRALTAVVNGLPATQQVGLRVYGATVFSRRDAGACTDSQRVVDLGAGNRAQLRRQIKKYAPYGETPIGYALQQAAQDLGSTGQRTIVLVSDGQPTCDPAPCQVAAELAKEGIQLKIEVVGLDVSGKARDILKCIADRGRGTYYDAHSADDLAGDLDQVATRARHPYKTSGTPIRGATSPQGAPAMASGSWLDELGGLGRSRDKLYYTWRRTTPGSTLHVSASLTTNATQDAVNLQVLAGQFQCGEDQEFLSDDSGPVVVASATVPNDQASASSKQCTNATTLILEVGRGLINVKSGFGKTSATPLELRVLEEPPVTNLDGLPKTLPDPAYKAPASAADPTKTVGGSSFATATDVVPGTYSGTIAPGDVQIFETNLNWGQDLTVKAKVRALSDRLRAEDPTWRDLSVRIYSPSRHRTEMPLSHFTGSVTEYGADVYAWTNRVAYRERYAGSGRRASESGSYLVAVSLQPDPGRTYRIPFTLGVAVRGDLTGVPAYGAGSSSDSTPTPSAAVSSSIPPPASITSTAQPSTGGSIPSGTSSSSSSRVAGLVLAGVGVLAIAAGGLAYALYRRRRN